MIYVIDMFDFALESRVSHFVNDLNQGIELFSKDPLHHSAETLKVAVRDYWDLCAAVLAGYAMNDYGNATLGDYRGSLINLGILGSLIGSFRGENRFTRNFLAGFGSLAHWWSNGIPNASEHGQALNRVTELVLLSGAWYADHLRRKYSPN